MIIIMIVVNLYQCKIMVMMMMKVMLKVGKKGGETNNST